MKNRFEAVPNPSCRFDIWDNESGEPVLHHDRLLTFASAKSAARIVDFLNDGRSDRDRARLLYLAIGGGSSCHKL